MIQVLIKLTIKNMSGSDNGKFCAHLFCRAAIKCSVLLDTTSNFTLFICSEVHFVPQIGFHHFFFYLKVIPICKLTTANFLNFPHAS